MKNLIYGQLNFHIRGTRNWQVGALCIPTPNDTSAEPHSSTKLSSRYPRQGQANITHSQIEVESARVISLRSNLEFSASQSILLLANY